MIPWDAPLATGPVQGWVRIPGSKSTSARSLLLAALAGEPSELHGVLDSRDTTLMREGLTTLGAAFTTTGPGVVQVTPISEIQGGGVIDCGLAGTVMRFLAPVAALGEAPTRFVGDAGAARRPMAPLLGALAELGAQVSQPHQLPFQIAQGSFRGGQVSLDASESSQFISALLLAAPRFPDGLELHHTGAQLPSAPHLKMTCQMLRARQVRVETDDATFWRIPPGPIQALDEQVEPDLTNAATFLAIALIAGGELSTLWPDGLQAADDLAAALAAFGGRISYASDPAGQRTITVSGDGRPVGADLDLSRISEFTPTAAALAVLASGPSRIRGVAHIRGHETDRLLALETALGGLGAQVEQTVDGLKLTPSQLHGGEFPTHADHRMAHAGALIGLVTPGVQLDDVGCTTKTLTDFPGLWSQVLGTGDTEADGMGAGNG